MEETFPIQPLFPHLPERLAGLETLAENLWWSWNPAARMLFKTLELTLGFRHENLSNLIDTLENVASRVTFGIIIAAMIVGSSMIITPPASDRFCSVFPPWASSGICFPACSVSGC